jgi:hypothetical protein
MWWQQSSKSEALESSMPNILRSTEEDLSSSVSNIARSTEEDWVILFLMVGSNVGGVHG